MTASTAELIAWDHRYLWHPFTQMADWLAEEPLAATEENVARVLAALDARMSLGWTDLGCQGSKYYRTPNIDRLADHGMRFTSGYTCGPNCQPTRQRSIRSEPPADLCSPALFFCLDLDFRRA